MRFNIALLAGLLLTPEALAVPSRLVARFPQPHGDRQSNFYDGSEGDASSITNTAYDCNWAGVMWAKDNGTFKTVTGTFTVPTPSIPVSGSNWASASAWVGIDGYTCQSTLFQTGIDFTVKNGQVSYEAWYEWLPDNAYYFSGISISAGDVIKLTVTATSTTSGTATVENLTNSQTVSKNVTSTSPLCQENAEWIVEDYLLGGQMVPFADFGTVTFTDAETTGTGTYTPPGAVIVDIRQNHQVLTSVSTSGSSVTIKYV